MYEVEEVEEAEDAEDAEELVSVTEVSDLRADVVEIPNFTVSDVEVVELTEEVVECSLLSLVTSDLAAHVSSSTPALSDLTVEVPVTTEHRLGTTDGM